MSDPTPQPSGPTTTSAHTRQKSTEPDTDSHPLIAPLVKWFRNHGGWLSPDVRIAYTDSSGFHLRAIRPLTSPFIVRCPVRLTLSHFNLNSGHEHVEHISSPLAKYLDVLPSHVLSRLLLIEQRCYGRGSLWAPYIACLPEPTSMTSAIWFDDSDRQCLAGTNLAQAITSTLAKLTEEWENLVHVLQQDDQIMPELLEFKRYKWASAIFSSRSFTSTHTINNQHAYPILFPVLDVLNHSLDANIEWDINLKQHFALKHRQPEAVRAGDEIFNNYFPKQNGEYLLAYGFALQDNPVEQFAIKMAIPPPMEEALKQAGLYDSSMIPFGMHLPFKYGDPNGEPHYLRTRGHPFRRYDNKVPFLRGIPPWIVHLHFIMVLHSLGIDPITVNKQHPPAAIVFDILLKLYEAIERKSQPLPLLDSIEISFPNVKQKYASIYRNGQAKVIHAIKDELRSVLDKLQVHEQLPSSAPSIISTTEALIALKTDFPENYTKFERALSEYYSTTISTWSSYSVQIAALEVSSAPAEVSVWKLILFVFAHLALTLPASHDKLPLRWFRALVQRFPLPPTTSLQDAEPALDEELLAEFVLGNEDPVTQLNRHKDTGDEAMVGAEGERLGDRVVRWAHQVVERSAFQLPGDDRILMYLSTGDNDDKWAYDGKDADEDDYSRSGGGRVSRPPGPFFEQVIVHGFY